MGVRVIKVSTTNSYKVDSRNPNPLVFIIDKAERLGDYVIAKVVYPGCTNFEGNKILVWKGVDDVWLVGRVELDPHFTEESNLVARFVPTEQGWKMAQDFVRFQSWDKDDLK